MASIPVYNLDGAKTGEISLDPAKLDKTIRRALLKEAYIAWQASQRQGTHATQDRGEVAGGGRKPWAQKGTGRARQGSTRSPQWVGGGHAHAIDTRDYGIQLPAAQRRTALRSSLRLKLSESSIWAVEGLETLKEPNTRAVAKFLTKAGIGGRAALIVAEGNQKNLVLSARNIPRVSVSERRNLNAGEILAHGTLVFTRGAIDALVKELA